MKIAFSPCPNDTFIFHAWVHHLIPEAPRLHTTYADIHVTNHLATTSNGPDILKISCAALPWVLSEYALLPCGGALGNGCGPLLLVPNHTSLDPANLSGRRVAVPSERSTAYLLFRLWAHRFVPHGVDIHILPFHEIMPAIRDGKVDAGLVIHEARFTYPSYQLKLLTDLGTWWEDDTDLPIPLGAIIARRSLNQDEIARHIRASIKHAWAHPDHSMEYISYHAQEMDPAVARSHIHLYVNSFSLDLSEKGYRAICTLLERAARAGLAPSIERSALM